MAGLFDEPSVKYARVAVERGVDKYPDGLTYGVPQRLMPLNIGQLVTVPLGRGNTSTSAWVLAVTDDAPDLTPGKETKQLYEKDRDTIALLPDILNLAKWMSNYYCAPIGPTLSTMLPGPVRQGTGLVTKQLVDLAENPPTDVRITPKQQRVLNVLAELPKQKRPIQPKELMQLAGLGSKSPIDKLIEHKQLRCHQVSRIEATWFKQALDARIPNQLTDEQTTIIDAIGDSTSTGYSSHLLFGVTGSGKTEIYIRLIEKAIAQGGTALVLVPEISLTPQTAARLMGRFPDKRIAILHSALTKSQRHQQWALVADGKADIVLGARSAVFAPLHDEQIKIIIVDEEHDHSFKQDNAPRYNGRDVAIRRAWTAKCPIILGSATPSMESWWNATRRNVSTLHKLTKRAPGLTAPTIEIVDMRKERIQGEIGYPILSTRLQTAINQTLATDGQILLLLNRRGFSPWITCTNRTCGWMLKCDHCDTSMVYHRKKPLEQAGFVRCHHCGTEQRMPKTCPDCSKKVIQLGAGTQRVEASLRESLQIPSEQIARLDTDTARKASDLHTTLERFGAGDIRVLLGTQMIAKGLDFPNVKLVGVIDADTAIDFPDFRASERTYQLVSQVCGRCGRGEGSATAIIQTFNPDAPAIILASKTDYETFATNELQFRQGAFVPPAFRMARFIIKDNTFERTAGRADSLRARLQSIEAPGITFSPVAPCVLPRIADRFRFDLTVTSATSQTMQHFLQEARKMSKSGRDIAIDVDPLSML
ncbi:MAG: primosomal protein N' [Phycisphaerae bacterium]|nr:primosomal protein N' [Phycisphaerae bacterium]|tara:strand:- start:11109 stop:13394 length:2286 start_codon:yes stop_codon:yes gene_type:complete